MRSQTLSRRSISPRAPLERTRAKPKLPPFLNGRRLLLLTGLVVATLLALTYVWQSWQAVYWFNQLHQAEQELSTLENQREGLRFQVAQAFSLQKLEEAAKKLHMIRPSVESKTLNYLTIVP